MGVVMYKSFIRVGVLFQQLLFFRCTESFAFQSTFGFVGRGNFCSNQNVGALINSATKKKSKSLRRTLKEDDYVESGTRRFFLDSFLFGSCVTSSPCFPFYRDNLIANAADTSQPVILKPPLDNRNYMTDVLENGLRILLCSDPGTITASAAMDVHVGSTSDPSEVAGLAHFTEHMLFLGTEKYPSEDSFSSFLAANGGSSNAFTDTEDTVYYFDMDGEKLLGEGLDRFASFFSCPLFTESATGRELNAIESENSKNLQSDIFRVYQLEKSRANPNHPFSKFFTGNKSTLLDETKRQGINLRSELIKFHQSYYSANTMTLAVIGPQSLSTLRTYVSDAFSTIPNKGIERPEESWIRSKVLPFSSNNKSAISSYGSIVEAVPVQDLRQLTLSWPIIYTDEQNKEDISFLKPDFYVGHLIGYEGKGSLLSFLKKKEWVNSLSAASNNALSDFETFDVSVELTNKGLSVIDEICETIFSYINMMRRGNIPMYVYDELLMLSEIEWRFERKTEQSSYAQSLATSMQKYPPALYIAGPRRLALRESPSEILSSSAPRTSFSSAEQRKSTIRSAENFISNLSVDNVYLTVLSKTFSGKTTNSEKWYGTDYIVREIPEITKARWGMSFPSASDNIYFPRPNRFIPSESGLRVRKDITKNSNLITFEERMKPIPPPALVRDDGDQGRWKIYFKEDDRFGEPKALIILQLLTPKVYNSPVDSILAQLYLLSVSDYLNEFTYDAQIAGLNYDVEIGPRGARLVFSGYNEKLSDFAAYVTETLVRNIKDVLPRNENELDRYKDRISRALSSFDVKQPYSHAIYYSSLLLNPRNSSFTNAALRNALSIVTLSQLTLYAETIWSYGKGIALIQGNMSEKEALSFVDNIDKVLGFKILSVTDYPVQLVALPLPTEKYPTKLKISEPNASNKNSASKVTIQCMKRNVKSHVLIEVLSAILETPFYEDLRTKRQLGYIVSSGTKAVEETRTLSLVIQSSVAPAEKLTNEIIKFLDNFRKSVLDPLTEDALLSVIKGLVAKKTEPDKKLSIEASRNWNEIFTDRFQFNRLQLEAIQLLDLSKDDLSMFWSQIYEANDRRILISEVIPQVGPASSEAPGKQLRNVEKNGETSLVLGIEDIEKFREEREGSDERKVLKS